MPLTTDPAVDTFTSTAPDDRPNIRWFVCFLLFAATTINYMDRSVLSLIEPLLHLPFMGWVPNLDAKFQVAYHLNYGHIVESFQIAYALGFLIAAPFIDRLGTKTGYALAISVWAVSSLSHSLVASVVGFCVARFFLGLGESGNFPAAIKATTEWFPTEERALATGLFNSGANAAFFIAPALLPFVTHRFGWQASFICTSSLGVVWLVLWLLFPYNRLRRASSTTQENLANVLPRATGWPLYSGILHNRGLYAFAIGKGLTDPVWWFYLFYLPMFLHDNYGLDLKAAYWPIVIVYAVSSVGSIGGGALSGAIMKRGHSVNAGRKLTLLLMAVCVLPIVFVPYMHTISPHSPWPAVGLIALAAAAHQGWSANLYSTVTDMFPSTSVGTVIGWGGAIGSLGGALFTWLVSHYFALHPLPIFILAATAYLLALGIFQSLVPRLGAPSMPDIPIGVT